MALSSHAASSPAMGARLSAGLRRRAKARAAFALLLTISCTALAQDWVRKVAGPDWQWFEDYAVLTGTYVVACEPQRVCEVGTGWMVNGSPWGGVTRFEGQSELSVYVSGSIHIRPADGKGPVKASLLPKGVRPFSLTWDW